MHGLVVTSRPLYKRKALRRVGLLVHDNKSTVYDALFFI